MTREDAGASRVRAKMELLAPAGGREQLEYAIRFGADAVYLAGERFGMRRRAANFSLEELPGAIAYAHEHGVAVHVACNVVMRDSDLEGLPSYFELLERAGADAAIIADLGAFRLARTHAPSLALHVSTQASVANAQAALAWYEMGARRIVVAREMSLAQIAALRAQVPQDLEIEAFAHGSMCMAYSGRCLISDYLNGRAANDGNCTQPCRWAWTLHEPSRPGQEFPVEEDPDATYILNSRDLSMLAHLDDLAAAGVDSIKLEGRGRKAFYVASVVNAYRQVLDGASPEEWAPELETFSHHPYSTGFFYGPASQAPTSAGSGSACIWVAEVVSCADDGAGGWQAEVVARNHFEEGDLLEVLSPGREVRRTVARDLRWVCRDEDGGVAIERVTAASRQMDRYLVRCDCELAPHDILRMRAPSGAGE